MHSSCKNIINDLYVPETEKDACGVGVVANISGEKENRVIQQALELLGNLQHRGGETGEGKSGDGAGILIQIPHEFYREELYQKSKIRLPEKDLYGCGLVFLPKDPKFVQEFNKILSPILKSENLSLICIRHLPVDNNSLGISAKNSEPNIIQIFIKANNFSLNSKELEKKLFITRILIENSFKSIFPDETDFYIPSLSTKTIVYKGLILANQLSKYFLDLGNHNCKTALALVHQRYSTNTFPSWKLAHPFRKICHNGEINTLKANVNSFKIKEKLLNSKFFNPDLQKILPLNLEGLSDSATLDAVLELLYFGGRSIPQAISLMVPEAWEKNYEMNPQKRAYYEYNSCIMEAWDGPSLIALTDGEQIAATLDRNGFRPARYTITKDNQLILASETGAVNIEPENVLRKDRIKPGQMLLIDTLKGRIIPDKEIKQSLASNKPYENWLDENLIPIRSFSSNKANLFNNSKNDINKSLKIFAYTQDEIQHLLYPMALNSEEAVGSMGSDIPLAVLSDKHVLLYDYFKQLFAQVTNPPLDAIREEIITSTYSIIGKQFNILEEKSEHCRKIRLETPIISEDELSFLKNLNSKFFRSKTINITYGSIEEFPSAYDLEKALERICKQAEKYVLEGNNIIILNDYNLEINQIPIPALLACSAVWQHLRNFGLMAECSIIIETAEAREIHHMATLLAYGASAICPILALNVVARFSELQENKVSSEEAKQNYLKALTKGIVKVMSKMGISTVQSYIGSQLFEIVGLSTEISEKYFYKTVSRISGIDLKRLNQEIIKRYESANTNLLELDISGHYFWRRNGERHLNNPQTIAKLQHAVRTNDFKTYHEYSELINDQNKKLFTLRGLFEFNSHGQSIDISEVESAKDIVKRFRTGAMSFGSISFEAHTNLAIAMNRIGGKSNSGEGGEDSRRFEKEKIENLRELSPWLEKNINKEDSLNSKIKQVASGRFGVTSHYLVNAEEIQIKIAQGAKPGEGGQLPGHKIDSWIASVRHSTPGVSLISPPPHHDIYSIEDLSQLIFDLKNANPRAKISVKLVSEVGVGTIAAGVAKAKADVILISGSDGGTGASPLSSIKYAGLPWELGLSEAHQVLVRNGLRDSVILETDGQLKTGRDIAIACLARAEEFGFSTAPLIASGCVMMRKCHLNTCPVGIATQDPELRKRFAGKPEHVINFMFLVADEVRQIMASLGFRKIDEMCGRVDKLDYRPAISHWKASGLDFSKVLYQHPTDSFSAKNKKNQDHNLESSLDVKHLLPLAYKTLHEQTPIFAELTINNTNRSVGTILGSEISKRYGSQGLKEDSIHFKFQGSAGQSFAAFIPNGLTLEIEGDANDYLAKGISGGKVIVYPQKKSSFKAEENIIIGNVAFYGATSGKGFIRGIAGERFCVRNSGAEVVVEGVGDHGCEYMTGGKVIILGKIARNFAAGMSGGIVYIFSSDSKRINKYLNNPQIEISSVLEQTDIDYIKEMLKSHAIYTESTLAKEILWNWDTNIKNFSMIISKEYKQALSTQNVALRA